MKLVVLILIISIGLIAFKPMHKPELNEYVYFLTGERSKAKDYILNQWKTKDLVILCERDHSEMTQYDLISDVIKSKYFIENVGSIFIEVGSISVQKRLLYFLNSTYDTNELREAALIKVYRDLAWPIWEKSNTYFMLLRISELNQKLKKEDKIQVYAIDEPSPTDSEAKSKEDYRLFEKKYLSRDRDSVLAENIIEKFDSIQKNSIRKKCLVIMNYRHAFLKNVSKTDTTYNSNGGYPIYGNSQGIIPCVGSILANHYPNNLSSIYINSRTVGAIGGQQPIKKGIWDASFKVLNMENLGFDFINSPFGKDSLDIWGFSKPEYVYSDVFTGMIYYLPFEKQINACGLDNFIDSQFIDTLYRRIKIYTDLYDDDEIEKKDLQELFKYKESKVYNLKQCQDSIEQWIKN